MKEFKKSKKLIKTLLVLCMLISAGCTNQQRKPTQILKYEEEKFEQIEEKEIKQGTREVNIEEKRYNKEKKAYVNGEDTLFTGIFSIRYAGHLLYFEEYKEGVLDGDKVWFGNDGTVGMREKYVDGKKNGDQITYHVNGNIRSVIPYVNNRIEGIIEWYDAEGLLIDQSEMKNGTGRFVKYWENGNIQEEGNYKNYRKVGDWTEYNKDKVVEKVITYSDSGKVLKTRWYN